MQIKSIKLHGINLVIEQRALSNNLQDVIGSLPTGGEKEAEPSGKQLKINELEITDTKVTVKLLPRAGRAGQSRLCYVEAEAHQDEQFRHR